MNDESGTKGVDVNSLYTINDDGTRRMLTEDEKRALRLRRLSKSGQPQSGLIDTELTEFED